MYCSSCGAELAIEHRFCPDCGIQNQPDNGSITSGNKSFNAIGTKVKNSSIHVGDSYNDSNNIDPSILNLKRHFVSLPWSSSGKVADRSSIFKLGTWGSIASIIGLLLPYITSLSYLPHWFMFGFGLSLSLLLLSTFLKKFRFTHFFGLKNFEAGTNDGVYLTEITGDCPWCGSLMKVRMLGKNNKDHFLLCERNPRQHRILFDSTVMPDINE